MDPRGLLVQLLSSGATTRNETGDNEREALLAGEIRRALALVDVVRAIARSPWTGELVVHDGTVHRALFFQEGTILGARSTSDQERFGAVMIRHGMLAPEHLDAIVAELASGRRFGDIALERGFIGRERLLDGARAQVEIVLRAALEVGDGAFAFLEGYDPAKMVGGLALDAIATLEVALVAVRAGVIAEPIARFNEAITRIHDAAQMHGIADALRGRLDSMGTPLDRALFAAGHVAPDGTVDARGVADALLALAVEDPLTVARDRLHARLTHAASIASGVLSPVERDSLAELIDAPVRALARPVPSREPEPAPLPPTRRAEPEPTASLTGGSHALLVVAGVAVLGASIGIAASVLRGPTAMATVVPSVTTMTQPEDPVVPYVPPAPATPSVTAEPLPPPTGIGTVGTVHARAQSGHRVWIDGRMVGQTPQSFVVPCGHRVVRIGLTGQPQLTDVPCGGGVNVELH